MKEYITDGVNVGGTANTKVLDADGLTLDDIFKKTTKGAYAGLMYPDFNSPQGGVRWALYCNGAQALATGAAALASAYISLA